MAKGHRAAGQQLEPEVEDVPVAVPGVLAGDDAVVEQGVGVGRQRAVALHLLVEEGKPVGVAEPHVEPEATGRGAAEARGVDAQPVGEPGVARTVDEVDRKVVEDHAVRLVDLRAVHALVALDIDLLVADLDVEGRRLGGCWQAGGHEDAGEGGDREVIEFHRSTPYLSSSGDVFEPWTATWQVVQFR
ncbi:MAG: hypothetical protein MUC56_14400 [Thermoanaerobaculales bacterium]|nr:hypothetical protein [Thermoanaerobaculales bacterium]